jgi:hypothetical protein
MYVRLLATPARVFVAPEPVRIEATSPATHFDVRQVLGTSLKDEIDYEAVAQTGAPPFSRERSASSSFRRIRSMTP